MACPALPLCGLATTEAERALPDINVRIRASMVNAGLPADEPLIVRMTGCPNGCARPYIAELGFVGDGPNSYQVCDPFCALRYAVMYVHTRKPPTQNRCGGALTVLGNQAWGHNSFT